MNAPKRTKAAHRARILGRCNEQRDECILQDNFVLADTTQPCTSCRLPGGRMVKCHCGVLYHKACVTLACFCHGCLCKL